MVVTTTATGKARRAGIEDCVIRHMCGTQLVSELERAEAALTRLERICKEYPRYMCAEPNIRADRNCLLNERRRIQRELDRRAHQADGADWDSAAEYAQGPQVEWARSIASQRPALCVAATEWIVDGVELREKVAA